jgi:NitT/TauT family transport system permease protein
MSAFKIWFATISLVLGAFALWEWLVPARSTLEFLVGRPSSIVSAAQDDFINERLIGRLMYTLVNALCGLLIGLALGYLCGMSVALSKSYERIISPVFNTLSVIPLFAVGPLTIFMFGNGAVSKVFLSAIAVAFLAIALTYQYVRSTPAHLREAVLIQSGSRRAVIRHVDAPFAFLKLLTNLRSLFGMAVGGAIIGEFLGATNGIGQYIVIAEGLFDVNRIWVGVFGLSVTTILIGSGFALVERAAHDRL